MSVLIHMEMPTSCFECKLLDYTDTFKCRVRFESLAREHGINISRPDWCPLIEIPPHGRLIDADALKAQWLEAEKRMGADEVVPLPLHDYITNGCVYDLDNAPTIIPAEEGEE